MLDDIRKFINERVQPVDFLTLLKEDEEPAPADDAGGGDDAGFDDAGGGDDAGLTTLAADSMTAATWEVEALMAVQAVQTVVREAASQVKI